MALAGFCRVCGQYVWLAEDGNGACGHPATELSNIYETEPVAVAEAQPAPEEASARRSRVPLAVKILVPLALVFLAVIGGVLFVVAQPEFVVTGVMAPGEVEEGETIALSVDVANEGWLGGETELGILLDGEQIGSASVDLGGGESTRVEIAVEADTLAGDYTLGIEGWTAFDSLLHVMTPASFEFDVSVEPDPLDLNSQKKTTVSVWVTNVGEAEGTDTLSLELDGKLVDERDVTLPGGSDTQEAFTIDIAKPGVHEVSVNGVSVEFDAHQLGRPGNGTIILNDLKGGSNVLIVTNNRNEDVLMVLSASGDDEPLLAVYVHAGSSHTIRGIKSGTYSYYYSHGDDWCTACKAFTTNVSYGRFEGDSTLKSSGSSYTESKVTFGLTEGEGTPSEDVPEGEFPTF
jgi:hypothetical protein